MRSGYVREGFCYFAKIRGVIHRVRVMQKCMGANEQWMWKVQSTETLETALLRSPEQFSSPACPQCKKGRGRQIDDASPNVWWRCDTCDHAFPLENQ